MDNFSSVDPERIIEELKKIIERLKIEKQQKVSHEKDISNSS